MTRWHDGADVRGNPKLGFKVHKRFFRPSTLVPSLCVSPRLRSQFPGPVAASAQIINATSDPDLSLLTSFLFLPRVPGKNAPLAAYMSNLCLGPRCRNGTRRRQYPGRREE